MKKILLTALIFTFTTTSLKAPSNKSFIPTIDWSKAFASRLLTGEADFSTAAGQADFIRYNYYLINGSTSEYSLSEGTLTYLPYLNSFLDGFSEAVGSLGYKTCADVPITGSGSTQGLDLTFSAGDKTIPSHFGTDGGATFEKKVVARQGGTAVIEIQLTCDGTLTSGSILMPISDFSGGQMGFEAFFQKDTANSSTFVDLFMEIETGAMSVRQAMRFMAPDSSTFKIYSLGTFGTTGNAVAIQGTPNGITQSNLIYAQDVTSGTAGDTVIWGDLSGITPSGTELAAESCIDLSTDATATGCPTIDDPGTLSVNGTTYEFKLNAIRNLALSSIL